ncbi:MAG: hypothetical protein M3T55_06580 [Pseudomonadota bacterium]|nr:hypothetical protein [Pseudomonadota bacterium]
MICQIDFLKGAGVIDSVVAAFVDPEAARDHAVLLTGLRHLRAATGFRITNGDAVVAQWPEAYLRVVASGPVEPAPGRRQPQ